MFSFQNKILAYLEQVRAYLGEVEDVKSRSDIQTQISDIQMQISDLTLKENQIKAEQYRVGLNDYEVAVRVASTELAASVDKFKAEAAICSAKLEAEGLRFMSKAEKMRVDFEKDFKVEGAAGVMNVVNAATPA